MINHSNKLPNQDRQGLIQQDPDLSVQPWWVAMYRKEKKIMIIAIFCLLSIIGAMVFYGYTMRYSPSESEKQLMAQITEMKKALVGLREERMKLEAYVTSIEQQLTQMKIERVEIDKKIHTLTQKISSYDQKYSKVNDRYNSVVGDSLQLLFTKEFGERQH
jgi:septal ring factor EnvC (AmiA/AmiB activator)